MKTMISLKLNTIIHEDLPVVLLTIICWRVTFVDSGRESGNLVISLCTTTYIGNLHKNHTNMEKIKKYVQTNHKTKREEIQ